MASDPLYINNSITIAGWELVEQFIRASGPGGQNVNKVATSVQLRFDVAGSASLPEDVRQRLIRQVGSRLTNQGALIIQARGISNPGAQSAGRPGAADADHPRRGPASQTTAQDPAVPRGGPTPVECEKTAVEYQTRASIRVGRRGVNVH